MCIDIMYKIKLRKLTGGDENHREIVTNESFHKRGDLIMDTPIIHGIYDIYYIYVEKSTSESWIILHFGYVENVEKAFRIFFASKGL